MRHGTPAPPDVLEPGPGAGAPRRAALVALTIVVLAALAAGFLFSRNESEFIRQRQYEALQAIGKGKAEQIARWRQERAFDVGRMAKSPFLRKAVSALLREPDSASVASEMRAHLQVELEDETYADALLLSPDGRILVAARERPDPVSPATARAVAAALEHREATFSDLYRCPSGAIDLDVARAMYGTDGQPLALVVLRSDAAAFLFPLIQTWPTPSGSAETLLVRRSGDEVVFLNELRHRAGTALSLRTPLTRSEMPGVQAALGKRGMFQGADYRGVQVLADLRPVPGSDWFLVSKVDTAEILAEARYRNGVIALLVAFSLVLAAITAAMLFRQRQASLFRKLYESERREGEIREELRTVFYSIGDAIIATDTGGRVLRLNRVAQQLTGWAESEATGRPVADVFRIVNEETRADAENPVARVLREGAVVGLANHTLLVSKDGKERPIADSGAPIRNEKGETTGVVLVFRDQTEERAAQNALQKSESFNRTIVESIPQKLFLKDRNAAYLAANEPYASSLGCRPEQLVGKDDLAFYAPELAEKYRADDRAVMESGKVKDIEERYVAKGREYWVHTIKAPVRDEAGHVTSVLGIFEDITDRKRAEQSLKDARDRLEEAQLAAHLGSWEFDSVNDEITGSGEFYRLFDVAPEGLARFSQFVERLHPDDRERVQQDVADALKQGRPYDTDYRVKLGGGGWRDLLARGRVFADADGKPMRMVGTCLDITERKRAEAEVRESERRYRTLAESLPHLVWTCRADGPCDYLSPRWVEYTGIPEAEQLGYRWLEQLHPDDRERVSTEWSAVAPRGAFFDIEFRLRRADGVYRWFKTRAIPLRDNDGKVVKWFGSNADIDDHKQANEALRASEARSRATLYSIGDGVVATDAAGNVLQMNPVAEALTGWSEAEAKGMPAAKVFHIVNEDTRAEVESPVARVLREGTVVGLANHTLLIARGGEEHPIADSGAPIRNEKGETAGAVLVFRDQAEERRADREVKQAEERFRTFFDKAPIGKCMTAPDGKLLRVNPAFGAMLGYSVEEMQTISFAAITHADDLPQSRECVRSLLAGERETWLMDKRYIAKDGHVVWTSVATCLQRDPAGKPLYFLTHIQDITERKLAEAELRIKNQVFEDSIASQSIADKGGAITHVNPAFLRLWGYADKKAALGKSVSSFFANPADATPVLEALASHDAWEGEFLAHRVDQTTFVSRGYATSLRNAAGELVGYQSTNLDVTDRKTAEDRIIHLNLVLKSIRNVNQIIVREKDTQTLIRRSCEVLTETRGYFSAWIALLDESGKYVAAASAGLGDAFASLENRLKSGQLAACGEALHQRGVQVVRNPAVDCPDCPAALLHGSQSVIAVRLEHEGHVHGLLVMSLDPGLVDLVEERDLIEEVADDIAYALHGLKVEKRRGAAEEEIVKHRDALEQRVLDRTAELQDSNKELEAFSYSVSHDLRAPLRAIDGFTRMLADDYGAQLDTEGKRLCSIVHDNTAKMGHLIDDLLAFSRLGRAEMNLSRVDMGIMASSIFHELTTPESRARIDFQVGAVPPALADPTLMRQVWTNLLSNAIKFSSKRERAVIKVSAQQKDGENVYTVHDDGAGFDMQYVGKLFGVFQRLHSSKEFEGTGVGLALVQRVIRRHGGRVWAEGEPDKGATFNFALMEKGP